jgi:RNA polymerase sigma-70 factor, ECF subfamily
MPRQQQTTPDDDDQTLLRRAATGDTAALGQLYDRYVNQVFSLALRIIGDRGAAEEITQDTFLRLWDNAEHYNAERGSLIAWVLTFARRRAIDELRSRRGSSRRREFSLFEELALDPDTDHATLADLRTDLQRALAELPSVQRQAIEYMFFGGLSPQEIAKRSACPLNTVYTRLRLGMEKLRAIFQRGGQTA